MGRIMIIITEKISVKQPQKKYNANVTNKLAYIESGNAAPKLSN